MTFAECTHNNHDGNYEQKIVGYKFLVSNSNVNDRGVRERARTPNMGLDEHTMPAVKIIAILVIEFWLDKDHKILHFSYQVNLPTVQAGVAPQYTRTNASCVVLLGAATLDTWVEFLTAR